jgi:aldehyde:ferredoxin oxidoreductase
VGGKQLTESLPGGYHGKVVRINLTDRRWEVEELDARFCRKYLGGAGFVGYYALTEIPIQADPFSAENKLIFATGPLTGLALSGAGRHCVGGLSPLTGGIAKSEAGEQWGAQLKRSGFDAVIVEGCSAHPVYVSIIDGDVQFHDADRVWGLKTKETQTRIRSELGQPKASLAMIGTAGENCVRYACIMHGTYDAAGRSGLGAVMGSKRLKAIAVKGSRPQPVVDPGGIRELQQWLKDNRHKVSGLSELGTTPSIPRYEEIGNLPVNNWRDFAFPTVDRISAQAIRDTIRIGMDSCFACFVRCKKVVRTECVDSAYGGPEMETLAALGSNCGIDDLVAIAKGSELCNAFSLDTISTGSTIAFAMECFENGLLTAQDTGGMELRFGDAKIMIQLIEMIARRKGIGDLLAEGSARAAGRIGKGAERFAMHVKKQEFPMHSPRVNRAGAVGYAVNPDGADHCNNLLDMVYTAYASEPEFTVPEAEVLGYTEPVELYELSPRKMALLRIVRLKRMLLDSLVLCVMIPYSYKQVARVVAAVTGWDTTEMELLRIAERSMNTHQLFNTRRGFTAREDVIPNRFFEPVKTGPLADKPPFLKEEFEKAKRSYYRLMGWDVNGMPHPDKLAELEIPV